MSSDPSAVSGIFGNITQRLEADCHAALVNFWCGYGRSPGGDRGGAVAGVRWVTTAVRHPLLNAAFGPLDARRVPPSAYTDAAAALARTGGPGFWWQPVTPQSGLAEAWLRERGAVLVDTLPGMACALEVLPADGPRDGLRVGELTNPADLPRWVAVLGEANNFDAMTIGALLRLEREASPDRPVLRFAAFANDELVATAALHLEGGVAGLFAVATRPGSGRQGFGRAVSLAALHWARSAGATRAVLQASAQGAPIYRRLGFVTCSHYQLHLLQQTATADE